MKAEAFEMLLKENAMSTESASLKPLKALADGHTDKVGLWLQAFFINMGARIRTHPFIEK